MALKEYRGILIFLAGLALVAITHYIWFFNFSILTYSDWTPHFTAQLRELFSWPWMWTSSSLGSVMITNSFYPIEWLLGLLSTFNVNFAITERLLFLWPTALLAYAGSYLLARKVTHSTVAALIGSFVYSYNVYFLLLETQHLNIALAYSAAPFAFILFIDSLAAQSVRRALVCSLHLFVLSFLEFRIYYIVLFALLLYFLLNLLFDKYAWRRSIKSGSIALLSVAPSIVLNLYWLIPTYLTGELASNSILSRGLFGSQFLSLVNSLTLFHYFWNGAEPIWFTFNPEPYYFWLIPIAAFLGLLVYRKNKQVLYFGIIALIGILLTKETDIPFRTLYPWLFFNVPGFDAFREASKFYLLIALGYSVLIASLIKWIWDQRNTARIEPWIRYAITFSIAFLFLWNTKPLLSGTYGTLFTPRHVPSDYLVLKNFILAQPDHFRTLWVPRDSRWSIATDDHPNISAADAIGSAWNTFLSTSNSLSATTLLQQQTATVNVLQKNFSNWLLTDSNVKYVIVPVQDIENEDDFFTSYGELENPNIRQWYIDELSSLPYLKRIDIGTKALAIFENPNYTPYVSAFTDLSAFTSAGNLDTNYAFVTTTLKKDFDFMVGTSSAAVPAEQVTPAFGNLAPSGIESNQLSATAPGGTSTMLYFDPATTRATFDATTSTVFISSVSPARTPTSSYTYLSLPPKSRYTTEYIGQTFTNAVPNPSFEEGAWTRQVGDCNNYDNNPILGMRLDSSDKTEGSESLELQATRHIACTSESVSIVPGKKYFLSFDYQSPNGENVGFYLGFHDASSTSLTARIPVSDASWHTYTRGFTAPVGATSAQLYIYSYATNGITNVITRYDNFHLTELPGSIDSIWYVDNAPPPLAAPDDISFRILNPTKKLVHISGATTPFYLSMSESYHPQWQLMFDNSKVHGILGSWVPWAHPDRVADSNHFALDGFLNGWYVDPAKLCAAGGGDLREGCTKNSDGSYTMDFRIEFWPQRWLYVGIIISGVIGMGIVEYLCYGWYRNRQKLRL